MSLLLNFLANDFRDELGNEVLEVPGLGFTNHDFDHLGADGAALGGLSVRGLALLVRSALGETNAKETKSVTISGLDVGRGLDQSVPFAHQRAELVSGHVHAPEVGQALHARHFLNAELELSKGIILTIGLEVSQRSLDDASHETVASNDGTLGAGDNSLTNVSNVERGRGLDIVPLFLGEGILNLLLTSLLGFSGLLVLSNGHLVRTWKGLQQLV